MIRDVANRAMLSLDVSRSEDAHKGFAADCGTTIRSRRFFRLLKFHAIRRDFHGMIITGTLAAMGHSRKRDFRLHHSRFHRRTHIMPYAAPAENPLRTHVYFITFADKTGMA